MYDYRPYVNKYSWEIFSYLPSHGENYRACMSCFDVYSQSQELYS